MVKVATYIGLTGKVERDEVGRVFVDFGNRKAWIIKGVPGLRIFEKNSRGRPRKHSSSAQKQRAYRERQKRNPLRKYKTGVSE